MSEAYQPTRVRDPEIQELWEALRRERERNDSQDREREAISTVVAGIKTQQDVNTAEIDRTRESIPKLWGGISDQAREHAKLSASGSAPAMEALRATRLLESTFGALSTRVVDHLATCERETVETRKRLTEMATSQSLRMVQWALGFQSAMLLALLGVLLHSALK